ncbi:MAG: 30S ribosomal protein S6 [Capsulimonadaceae bacterium]|nr:30S ribosomal protein S6 [Capsulimonadaceae bacterium]
MPNTIRFYEVVYIIAPDKTDEQLQAIVDKYTNLITSQGGVIERTDIWERRRLAYAISGYSEGIYVVTHFRALPAVEAELKRVFRISEDTLRSIVVRPDEEYVSAEPAPRLYRPDTAVVSAEAPVAPVASTEPVVAVVEVAPEPQAVAAVAEETVAEATVAEEAVEVDAEA